VNQAKIKFVLLGFPILVLSSLGSSQNWVPNWSFEQYVRNGTLIRHAKPWQSIEEGDFYHERLKDDTSRFAGAFEGTSYIGLRFRKKHREYIQVKLTEILEKDRYYRISFYWRKAYWSTAKLGHLGVYVGTKAYRKNQTVTAIDTADDFGLDGAQAWIKSSFIVQSKGRERYLCIGNFSDNFRKDIIKDHALRMFGVEAYYFIDAISLEPIAYAFTSKSPEASASITKSTWTSKFSIAWNDSLLNINPNHICLAGTDTLKQWSAAFPQKRLLISISHQPYPWYIHADVQLDRIHDYITKKLQFLQIKNPIYIRQHILSKLDNSKNNIEFEMD
jgi:hypothetical protein